MPYGKQKWPIAAAISRKASPREGNNEDVLYRWSILRKYISRYLFLEVRRRKGHPLLLHSVYAISAAIAMIFATFVAFFWQGRYGALSNNLFLALVIAYISKTASKKSGASACYLYFANGFLTAACLFIVASIWR